ncbi:hypothetical protein A2U01_0066830, partial [Trifolium medium]|nr:hypothetical protein [Trifolium medium]
MIVDGGSDGVGFVVLMIVVEDLKFIDGEWWFEYGGEG